MLLPWPGSPPGKRGINVYFDFARRSRLRPAFLWRVLSELRPGIWLDFHSWHLGKAEGLYGPDPRIIGEDKYASLKPLIDAVAVRFPINERGADALECSSTQANADSWECWVSSPEFQHGLQGADGRWKPSTTRRPSARPSCSAPRLHPDRFPAEMPTAVMNWHPPLLVSYKRLNEPG